MNSDKSQDNQPRLPCTKLPFVADTVARYIEVHSLRLVPAQQKLIEVTKQLEHGKMMGSPDVLQLLQNLIRIINAKKAIDVGVFTGCSSVAQALALPGDGKVVALDVSEETANIGKPYWEEAGVAHKIDLRIGPALESLDKMIANGESGTYDFAFIDADKREYEDYYEKCLQLLRPGGIIAVDNVLQSGAVAYPERDNPRVNAIRAFNKKLRDDQRVHLSMLRIGDGLTLAFKKDTEL